MSPPAPWLADLRTAGLGRWPGCLSPEHCSALAQAADVAYDRVAVQVPPGYLPTAASLRVPETAELIDSDDFFEALTPIAAALDRLATEALPTVRAVLGATAAPLEGQRWLRRQYPPQRAPQGHAPHGWHQDGALHFDFLGGPDPTTVRPRALLTLWVPLVACGADAPGLAWVPQRLSHLVPPLALTAAAVSARWGAAELRPVLAAGEALVFAGDLLHRTATSPAMGRVRTSLELRFEAR